MTRTRIFLAALALVLAISPSFAANPKTKSYPFQLTPDKAISRVEKLEKVSGKKIGLTDDERKLFADARDGRLDTFSFAEACLMASGVTDAARRKAYLAKLDTIEKDARQAIARREDFGREGREAPEVPPRGTDEGRLPVEADRPACGPRHRQVQLRLLGGAL